MTLFEIDEQLRQLIDNGFNAECIDEETGEIDTEKAEQLLNAYQADLDTKIENIALLILELKAKDKSYKEYLEEVKKKRDQNNKKVESLQNYLSNYMQMAELKRFSTVKCNVSFRKSTTCQITDEDKIPSIYKHVVMDEKIDKTAIKKAIANGEKVEGAELVENSNLQVKG